MSDHVESIRASDGGAAPIVSYVRGDGQSVQEEDWESAFTRVPAPSQPGDGTHWLNCVGLQDAALVERLGSLVDLHGLAVEDILNSEQRPIMEVAGDYLYIVLKAPDYEEEGRRVCREQIGIVLGRSVVLSFQDRAPDVFAPVMQRLRTGRIRPDDLAPDSLAYWLIDAVVDHYFVVLGEVGERIEELEEDVLARPSVPTLEEIHALKREMILLRRSVWPLREIIGSLLRDATPLVREGLRIYLRDVYDHTIQVMETIETNRDVLSGLFDIYLSSTSNRTNEIMRVLTVIATLFIPLTFVAGVYGMNFHYMPELHWRWSYPILWALMLAALGVMVAYFRRKGWL